MESSPVPVTARPMMTRATCPSVNIGKKSAGRLLYERTWDESPEVPCETSPQSPGETLCYDMQAAEPRHQRPRLHQRARPGKWGNPFTSGIRPEAGTGRDSRNNRLCIWTPNLLNGQIVCRPDAMHAAHNNAPAPRRHPLDLIRSDLRVANSNPPVTVSFQKDCQWRMSLPFTS